MPERDPHASRDPDASGGPEHERARGVDAGADAEQPEDAAEDREVQRRHPAVRALRIFAAAIATVVLLLLLFYLFLQTPPGQRIAKGYIEDRINQTLDGAEVVIDDLEGNILGHLTLYDVRLITTEGEKLAEIDTVRANYRLLALLQNRLHLYDVYLGQPSVWMEQEPDGSWDLFDVIRSDSAAVDTAKQQAALVVQLDSLTLNEGTAEADFNAPPGQPPLRAYDIHLNLSDFRTGESLRLGIDTLWGAFRPPTRPDEEVRVWAVGTLLEGEVALSSVHLESPSSEVSGEGTLVLPQEPDAPVRAIDFELTAAPLAFHDVAPFLPMLDPDGQAQIHALLSGTSRELDTDLEIQLADGGHLALEGLLALTGSRPAYDLALTARRFDPGYVLATMETGTTLLNGRAQTDLSGAALETLSGEAAFSLFDSRIGSQLIRQASLAGDVADGSARVDASAELRGGSFEAGGTIELTGEAPAYALEGSFRNVQLGELLQNPDQQSDLNGRFDLEGAGFDISSARVDGQVVLGNSVLNGTRIQRGVVAFRLRDGALYVDGELLTPSGSIDVRGIVTFEGDRVEFTVREGRFENLDLSLLTGNPANSSNLTGTFTATGSLGGNGPLSVRANVSIEKGTFQTYRLAGASLDVALTGDRMTLDGELNLEEGNLSLQGQVSLAGEQISYRITEGSFENLDLADITGDPSMGSDLTGTFTAYGTGTDLATLSLNAELQLAEGTFNRQAFQTGRISLDVRQGQLAFAARLETQDGGFTFRGTSDLLADEITVALDEGSFRRLNIGALLGIPWLDTRLSGALSVEGGPIALQTGTFTIVAELDSTHINEALMTDGRLVARFARGYVDADAALNFAQGTASFQAAGGFFAPGGIEDGYRVEGQAHELDVAALAGVDTLSSSATFAFDVEGAGMQWQTMELEGHLGVDEMVLGEATLTSLTSDFLLDDGVLFVDTLQLASSFADAAGSGRIVLVEDGQRRPSDFVVEADVRTLAPLQPFLPINMVAVEDASVTAHVTGRRRSLDIVASGEAATFAYEDIRVSDFTGRVVGRLDSLRSVEQAELTATTGFFSMPAISIEDVQLEATYTGDEVAFDAALMVDERRNVELAGRVDLAPEINRLLVEQLEMQLEGDTWQLLQPATVSLGDPYRVRNFLLYSDDQQIALDGVIDPNGQQNLVATVENFRLGAVADLFGYDALGGRISGFMTLTGAAVSPNLDGRLLFDLTAEGEPVGEGTATVAYAGQELTVDAQLENEEGGMLTADGTLPLDLRLAAPDTLAQQGMRVEAASATGEIDLSVRADSFAISWVLEPFLDPDVIERMEGYLGGQATIAGTYDDPRVRGDMRLSEGLVRLTATEVTYQNITGVARLQEDSIFVESLRMETEDGSLEARGPVLLSELTLGEFALDVELDNFMVIDTREQRAVASGSLDVTGTTDRPVITGSLSVVSADVYMEGSEAQVEVVGLTPADLRMLERNFGLRVSEQEARAFDLYQATTLDLDVELETDTWLRARQNPEMNIQLTGQLNVVKEPFGEALYFGTIEINEERSYITQFGRRFNLTEGTIRLNGQLTDARIDARAELNVPVGGTLSEEVALALNVSGSLSNLDLELTSGQETPMEGTAVLSTLVFGSPAAASLAPGALLEQQGALLAFSQATSLLEGVAGERLGLDVVEIDYDALLGTTLTAGKYFQIDPLPRPLFAAVRQPISEAPLSVGTGEGTEFTLEYGLLEWMLVRLAARQSAFRLDLFYEYSY